MSLVQDEWANRGVFVEAIKQVSPLNRVLNVFVEFEWFP